MVKAPSDLLVEVDKEEKHRWNGLQYPSHNTCKHFVGRLANSFIYFFHADVSLICELTATAPVPYLPACPLP